jgi:hypothetical protein
MWTSEHGADNTVEFFSQWGVKQMLGKKSNKVPYQIFFKEIQQEKPLLQ